MSAAVIDTSTLPGEALELGSPLAEFRATRNQPWILITLLAAVGVIFITMGLPGSLIGQGGSWGLVILGAIPLAAAALQVYAIFRNRDLRVVMFDKGFVRVGSGHTNIIRWDEIIGVYQSITTHYRVEFGVARRSGTSHTYTVWTEDHRSIILNDTLTNVAELGKVIQQRATELLLPYYIGDYEDGETLNFNGLRVSKEGISTRRQTLPWDQVEDIGLVKGSIVVHKRGMTRDWATQSVSMTPNLLVFLHIVHQVAGVRPMAHF